MQNDFNFDSLLENIIKLEKNKIKVICKTPINSITQNSFYKIKEWCENNNIIYYYSSELFDTYDNKDVSKYKISNENVKKDLENEEFQILKKIKFENGIKRFFDCKAGKYDLIITHDWNILPCFLLKNNKQFTFSLEKGFDEAYKNLVQIILIYKNKQLKHCSGCKSYNLCKECAATALVHHDKNICYQNNAIRKK